MKYQCEVCHGTYSDKDVCIQHENRCHKAHSLAIAISSAIVRDQWCPPKLAEMERWNPADKLELYRIAEDVIKGD